MMKTCECRSVHWLVGVLVTMFALVGIYTFCGGDSNALLVHMNAFVPYTNPPTLTESQPWLPTPIPDDSLDVDFSRPPYTVDPACPKVFVFETVYAGTGHRLTTLAFALAFAARTGSTLVTAPYVCCAPPGSPQFYLGCVCNRTR